MKRSRVNKYHVIRPENSLLNKDLVKQHIEIIGKRFKYI